MNLQSLTSVDTRTKPVFAQKDYRSQKEAQKAWGVLCDGTADAKIGLQQYMKLHGNIFPEAFDNGGRYKTRRGYEFLRGKRRNGICVGGPLGRARVLAGQPLELRRIPFSAVPELKELEFDISLQFMPELVKLAADALKAHIVGPAFGCIENGRVGKGNHFHAFVTPGSCTLGASNGIVPDEQLPRKAAYLGKGPCWDFETALAYLKVKQAYPGGRVASRYFHLNLGNKRTQPVTLKRIEEVLGYSLAKPEAFGESVAQSGVSPVEEYKRALAALPILEGATLQESDQVIGLHRVWAEGRYDGVPLKLPGVTCPDLGIVLKFYFRRKWLFPGEVASLVDIATAVDLGITTPKQSIRRGSHTGHVRPYRSTHDEKVYQTGHVGQREKVGPRFNYGLKRDFSQTFRVGGKTQLGQ